MSQALTISDALYVRLEGTVRTRGLSNIEQLLEDWQAREDELCRRQAVLNRIDALRERLAATYGEMPDSTDLLQADRAR